MDTDSLSSPAVPFLLGLAFVAATAARSAWMWRVHGINPYVIDHGDPVHRFVGQVFATVVTGLFLYFGACTIWPSVARHLGLLVWATGTGTRHGSVVLMTTALAWTTVAQIRMGSSWRIGIPAGDAPMLRTDGPFAWSRNPIFLGMLTVVLGMTLWSPSAVTITLLVTTYVALEVQIRGEEVFLERMHGKVYLAYRKRTRRWL